jgi:hypothetical protein
MLPSHSNGWNSFQAYNDALWTKGDHSIKFGFAMERMLSQVMAKTDPKLSKSYFSCRFP